MSSKTLLCAVDAIEEGKAKGFYLAEGAYFAVKKHGEIHCYRNLCPHLGTPLEWQEDDFLDYDGELIQCASHGALFVIDTGECVAGPCSGDWLTPAKISIEDGSLFLLGS